MKVLMQPVKDGKCRNCNWGTDVLFFFEGEMIDKGTCGNCFAENLAVEKYEVKR